MTKVTLQARYKKNIEIKEKMKKMSLKTVFKTRKMTCCERLFHKHDATTENDKSPTVIRRVQQTTCIDDDVEQVCIELGNQLDD